MSAVLLDRGLDPERHARAPWPLGAAKTLSFTARDLVDADAVWLVSSARIAAAVHRLDGEPLRGRVPVETAHRLLGLA